MHLKSRIRMVLTLAVAITVIAAPAFIGLGDASANPEPTTWGQLKGLYGGAHTSAAWSLITGILAELLG